MRNKIFVITAFIHLFTVTLKADTTTSAKIKNTDSTYQSLYAIINKQSQSISELDKKLEFQAEQNAKSGEEMERIMFLLKLATYLVEAIAVMLAIYGGISFFKRMEGQRIMDEAERVIEKFETDSLTKMNKFDDETDEKLKKLISVSEKFEKESTEKMEKFDHEADAKLKELLKVSERTISIEKSLKGNQDFIKHGLENIFDFLNNYISKTKRQEKDFMDKVFKARAISSLYSFEENIRFIGISILMENGVLNDIKHLEAVLFNAEENDSNKRIAKEAIVSIHNRIKEPKKKSDIPKSNQLI